MKVVRIGLVCEGVTDQIVFERIINAFYHHRSPDLLISFRDLQPAFDATSGCYTGGGWTEVYRWCVRNDPEAREGLYLGEPLFEDDDSRQCDLLIVNMDADVWKHVKQKCSVDPSNVELEIPGAVGKFIEDAIREWLWGELTTHDPRQIVCIAVQMIESWLAIGLGAEDVNEYSTNAIERMAALIHVAKGRKGAPPKLVKKSQSNYITVCNEIGANLKTLPGKISELASLFMCLRVAHADL